MAETTADSLEYGRLPFWQWGDEAYEAAGVQEVNVGIPLDSLLPHRELPDTVYRTSLFTHHSLAVEHRELIGREGGGVPVWVFGVLLLFGALLVLYYRLRKIKPGLLFSSLVGSKTMERLIRECNLNRSMLLFPMGMLLVGVVAMPVHTLFMSQTGMPGYLLLVAGGGLLYVVRNGMLRLLGNVFEQRQSVSHYITNVYLFHLADATVLVALLPFYYYLPWGSSVVMVVAGVFVVLAFVWRMVRGVKMFFAQPNGSCFYLFYYLCTVELIPVLVVIKLFITQ